MAYGQLIQCDKKERMCACLFGLQEPTVKETEVIESQDKSIVLRRSGSSQLGNFFNLFLFF